MISTADLINLGFLDHPFLIYPDTRFYYPHISEQRKVIEVVYGFINNNTDPQKNLGVVTGPASSGKTILAQKIAATVHPFLSQGVTHGIYLNTNVITEPRHFLMTILEWLNLPSSRSNENRLNSLFDYLDSTPEGLLMVLDGPPVDQEYLSEMLRWSVEHNKKIKVLIFLNDLFDTSANLGELNAFLGLYHPFKAPTQREIANLLLSRCKMAGHVDPLGLLTESALTEIVKKAHPSLVQAMTLSAALLEEIAMKKQKEIFSFNL